MAPIHSKSNFTGKSQEAQIFPRLERERSYLFLQLHQARAEKVLHCCQLSYTFKNKCVFLVMVRVQISRESKNQNGKATRHSYLFRLRLSEGSVLIKGCSPTQGEKWAALPATGRWEKQRIPHWEQVKQPRRDAWDTQGMSLQDHLCDPARQGSTCVNARAVPGSPRAVFASNYMEE